MSTAGAGVLGALGGHDIRYRSERLVGRTAELAVVASAVDRAAAGHGEALVVEGEAGIGKTRLVEEIAVTASRAGFEVSTGTASEVERRRPFGVVAEALGLAGDPPDPAYAEVAGLLTGANGPSGADMEYRIGEAVLDLVESRCAGGRVALVLEDLHWADPATVSCLGGLARVCRQLPLLLVLTVRPLPRDQDLDRLLYGLRRADAPHLALDRLADDEVVMLAGSVLRARPGAGLRDQLSRAGGNPLFVLELLAELQGVGALVPRPRGVVDVEAGSVSAVPSLAILHRLSFLPRATLDMLSVASVLGSAFTAADLSLLTGRPAAELAVAVRDAMTAGVLAERGDRLAFRHELIRDTLYGDLPATLRAAMHRDLADRLAAAGQPPGRVAEHLLRGAEPGDGEAVRWLYRAAEEAGRRAPTVAVDLLDHALALADPADPLRGRLAADRAVALMWCGRSNEGEAACQQVLDRHDDPERAGALHWLLLRSMLIRGRVVPALAHLDRMSRMGAASEAERAHFAAAESFARLILGELDAALGLAERAVEIAERAGDPLAVCESLNAKAQVLGAQGRIADATELAVSAVRRLGSGYLSHGPQTTSVVAARMLLHAERGDEGREVATRGRMLNESIGARTGIALHQLVLGEGLYLLGEWDDAVAEIEASFAIGEGRETPWPVRTFGVLAMVALHRDDLVATRRHLARGFAAVAESEGLLQEYRLLLADALLDEALGRPERALARLRAAWESLASRGIGSAYPEVGPELVRRLVRDGAEPEAKEVAAAVAECAAHNGAVPRIVGAARVCRGLADGDTATLLAGVEAYRAGAHPLGLALACEDAATVLAGDGHRGEARQLLEEAYALYEQLGAARGSSRATAALRALGVRRGTRAARRRARTGWDSLTPTERKVVALVAARLSNPEIAARMYLSRRTVETHVSHALAKLGLRSRVELAAEAERRGVRGE